VITGLLAAGGLLQAAWPGALEALRQESGGAWWRTCTAPFVQTGGGLAGALFNIVSAAVIVALAEWQWGRLVAAAVWLTGAWAPVGDVARLAGYHVAAADASAYSAGSSGVTYFTAATLCAALLCRGAGRVRLLGLIGPAIALVMWIGTDDGHGVLFIEGFVLGLLWAAPRTLGTPRTLRARGTRALGKHPARASRRRRPAGLRTYSAPAPTRTWHAIAAAATTLSESTPAARAPGCIGMRTA
jgi:hypothetical protein